MRKLAAALAICASQAHVAWAVCSRPQPRLVCAEYSSSRIIAEAKLVRVDPILENNDPTDVVGNLYTVRIIRTLRGTAGTVLKIYEGNDSGRASFKWKVGTTYVLFLFPSHENRNADMWALDGCGNSGPVSRSASVLEKISRIDPNSAFGTIYGLVSDPALSLGLENVRLRIRGASRTYEATSDQQGRFRIKVAPGEYSIESVNPDRPLMTNELSYEDARHFHIEAGGCSQVQLTQTVDAR